VADLQVGVFSPFWSTVMADTNRGMFWRMLRRLLSANRGRLFVMLLALGAGAAVTAALLNLQVDAKRRLTTEFRAFGANVVIAPGNSPVSGDGSATLAEQNASRGARELGNRATFVVPFLYFVGKVQKGSETLLPEIHEQSQVAVAGTHLTSLGDLSPGWSVPRLFFWGDGDQAALKSYCFLGAKVSEKLSAQKKDVVEVFYGNQVRRLEVVGVLSAGGEADNQIFMELDNAQELTNLSGRASLIEVSFPGQPAEIDKFIHALAARLPDDAVGPIRQFTEGEAKIYNRISGLLTATVGIVLLLTALCVMAAMTNVAIERKMDVGLMKAIGGATQRVVRLFLAEAALLGLGGGLIGAALGMVLSIGLGKAVFGVAARPRLIVYPVAVGLTILVAVVSAFPLRRLASIRPASVFRGEA